ncbi:transferase [Mycobacteriaceae bacterium 1482268.1]|nr:transferase [Mycobacteriaceae bacterium 1482268.1]
MSPPSCRFCRGDCGTLVLDIGEQPACDDFPLLDNPGPDPAYPLQMWLCATCGLAQLVDDPTEAKEPRGVEPTALVEQSEDAVNRVAAAGWLPAGRTVDEYGSPHGGSWLKLIEDRGLTFASEDEPADVVVDCFGLMHCKDQAAAIAERAQRVAQDGVLLLQYHELRAIVRQGQWNMLRLGHYAYYSMTTLVEMLAQVGFTPRTAWAFDLYGGTVLLAATRDGSPDSTVTHILREEEQAQIRQAHYAGQLQDSAKRSVDRISGWLRAQKADGHKVFGYGAASRAVALLAMAGVDRDLLMGVADASAAKWGRRMPGTDVPIVSPAELSNARPDRVLLLLPDLINEVRTQLPEIEARGGAWVSTQEIGA